jgi:hypothetical protein
MGKWKKKRIREEGWNERKRKIQRKRAMKKLKECRREREKGEKKTWVVVELHCKMSPGACPIVSHKNSNDIKI